MSYQQAEESLELLTGMRVSDSTQQRLVHRQEFPALLMTETVNRVPIDGGK